MSALLAFLGFFVAGFLRAALRDREEARRARQASRPMNRKGAPRRAPPNLRLVKRS